MVNILIAGDYCPQNASRVLLENKEYKKVFADFISILDQCDYNIVNLECPVVVNKSTTKPRKIGYILECKVSALEALQKVGFDMVTLANNHFYDWGNSGVIDTLETCKKLGLDYVGGGIDIQEAKKILYKEIKGKKIAFINFCENEFSIASEIHGGANPLNLVSNFYQIKEARLIADYVVVIVHGGHEGYKLPSPRMVDTYRYFIDIGASVVISHHSHCYSGFENYNNGLIFYGLGNFLFDWPGIIDRDWNFGYCVKLLFENKGLNFELIPYKQNNKIPGLQLYNNEEKQAFDDDIQKLNNTIVDRMILEKEWKLFAKSKKVYYLNQFECFQSRIADRLRHKYLLPFLLSKSRKLRLLNLIRCESHREMTIESLKE